MVRLIRSVSNLIEHVNEFSESDAKELYEILYSSKKFFRTFILSNSVYEIKRYKKLYEGYKDAYSELQDIIKTGINDIKTEISNYLNENEIIASLTSGKGLN